MHIRALLLDVFIILVPLFVIIITIKAGWNIFLITVRITAFILAIYLIIHIFC